MVVFFPFYLALTLLVARVCADDAHHAFTADDAAVLANATNRTTYFHCFYSTFVVERMVIISKTDAICKGGTEKINKNHKLDSSHVNPATLKTLQCPDIPLDDDVGNVRRKIETDARTHIMRPSVRREVERHSRLRPQFSAETLWCDDVTIRRSVASIVHCPTNGFPRNLFHLDTSRGRTRMNVPTPVSPILTRIQRKMSTVGCIYGLSSMSDTSSMKRLSGLDGHAVMAIPIHVSRGNAASVHEWCSTHSSFADFRV